MRCSKRWACSNRWSNDVWHGALSIGLDQMTAAREYLSSDIANLMTRFLEFRRRWESNRLVFNINSEASRAECTVNVLKRIRALYVGEFVPLAYDIVRLCGSHRFQVAIEPPERDGPEEANFAWWLTESHDRIEAARRLIAWAAKAADPDAAERGPQEMDQVGLWAQKMLLCAIQREEPAVVRATRQWLGWVYTLLDRLLDECGVVGYAVNRPGSKLTSIAAYRSWKDQQEGTQSPTARRLAEVAAPCELLLNLAWQTDVIPVDLSVEAVSEWFDFYLAIPTNQFDGGRLHEWQIKALPQDAGEELTDCFRLLDALVAAHGWVDPPREIDVSGGVSARSALIRFREVLAFIKDHIRDGNWQAIAADPVTTVQVESTTLPVADPLPADLRPDPIPADLQPVEKSDQPVARYVFRKTGKDVGEVAFGESQTRPVKWLKPMCTIHAFLSKPGQSLSSLAILGRPNVTNASVDDDVNRATKRGVELRQEAVYDDDGRAAIDARIAQLEHDIKESVAAEDNESLEKEREELEELIARRKAMRDHRGRARKAMPTPAEKARNKIHKDFERAIEKLGEADLHELVNYLMTDGRITIGLTCCYNPGPNPILWEL